MSGRLFTGARIPAGDGLRAADFLVAEGRFVWFGEPGTCAEPVDSRMELDGRIVLPGVVDAHVHFDDPGYTWRETFETGTRAAAAGGVSCVADMPCTSVPPVVDAGSLAAKEDVVARRAMVDYLFWGGICANRMEDGRDWRADLRGLAQAGIGALKCYLHSGMDSFRALSADQLHDVSACCRELDLPLGVHAEDGGFVLGREAVLRSAGRDDAEAFLESRPAEAELRAVELAISVARKTGARLHVVHLGSGAALEAIARAASAGVAISAETCPHYLEFTHADFARLGSLLKTAPPVKSAADRDRLWSGLRDGELTFLATDHAAGEWPREKRTGSFWSDYGGIPGVELLLPWAWTRCVSEGRLGIGRLVELLSLAPARFLGIGHRKGALRPGLDADFAVLVEEPWTVSAAGLHNLNRYTPFAGVELAARVEQTWLRGAQVYDAAGDAFPAGMGFGRRLCRGRSS